MRRLPYWPRRARRGQLPVVRKPSSSHQVWVFISHALAKYDHTHRINVFTLAALTSYSFFTASLIWRLFDRISTMNTSVLCSSIFFIADSVFSGLHVT